MRPTVLIVVLMLAITACSPVHTTLSRLVADQDAMSGKRVVVTGTVVTFDDPDGGVDVILEDADQNRVLLLPGNVAAGFAGSSVEATGMFEFDPGRGRLLWVEEIAPAPDG